MFTREWLKCFVRAGSSLYDQLKFGPEHYPWPDLETDTVDGHLAGATGSDFKATPLLFSVSDFAHIHPAAKAAVATVMTIGCRLQRGEVINEEDEAAGSEEGPFWLRALPTEIWVEILKWC
jgi:hypothetical protein